MTRFGRIAIPFSILSILLLTSIARSQPSVSGRFDIVSGATIVDAQYHAQLGVPVDFRALQVGEGFAYTWTVSQHGDVIAHEVTDNQDFTYTFNRGGVAVVDLLVKETTAPYHGDETSQALMVLGSGARGGITIISPPEPPIHDVTFPPPTDQSKLSTNPETENSAATTSTGTDAPLIDSTQDDEQVRQGRWQYFLQRRGLVTIDDLAEYDQRLVEYRSTQLAPLAPAVCVCGHTSNTTIGPSNIAGRVLSISPHPTSTATFLVGTPGGGLWETTNGGSSWTQYSLCLPEMSLGAVAYAPSNPTHKYAVTGEIGDQRGLLGIGILTTTDGSCWTLYGASNNFTGTPYAISVNPTNENDLVVATTDGVFRSTLGGAGWTLERSTTGGQLIYDLVRNPNTPATLYAVQKGYNLLVSTDSGVTWNPIGSSFPFPITMRATIAICANTPTTVAVSTAVTSGGQTLAHIYRTTTAGTSWNWSDLPLGSNNTYQVDGFGHNQVEVLNALTISPTNPNIMVAGSVNYIRSTDGGNTWAATLPSTTVHIDNHDLAYNGSTLIIGNDGGIWTSTNDGSTATAHNTGLQTVEFYSINCDNSHRNRVVGGTQDNGIMRRSDSGGTTWTLKTSGDTPQTAINNDAPSIVYASNPFSAPSRSFDITSGTANFLPISPPYGSQDNSTLQNEFNVPLVLDPTTPTTVYTATYRLWKSSTGGDSWTALPNFPGNPTSAVSVIAIAPSNSSIIFVSSGSGFYKTTNGGSSWSQLTGLPTNPVNAIAIDPTNPSTVFVAMPYPYLVYWSTNGGSTWSQRASGLPSFAALSLQVDPGNTSTLLCGTDVGLYRSTNQGSSWTTGTDLYGDDPVESLSMLDDRTLLRIGTHGNGAFEESWVTSTNQPPTATISGATTLTVTVGTQVMFSGSTADVDGTVTGVWTFPDTWQRIAVAGGSTMQTHIFNTRSIFPFPVTLTAIDSSKARASAVVMVTVQ